MSVLSRELIFLILQYLDEEKFKGTVHMLEKESGLFFNMKYFEHAVIYGEWDEVEKYLSGFTKHEDNRWSMKTIFEIRKHRYLEALDKRDDARALEILRKDLKAFSTYDEDLFKEIALLLSLADFRENVQLTNYGDTKSARAVLFAELKKLIEANPLFRGKLKSPILNKSRLRTLINHSLNWQHSLCENPNPEQPDIKTLYVDHKCGQPEVGAPSSVANQLMGCMPKVGSFPQLAAHNAVNPTPGTLNTSLGGWMANPSAVIHQALSGGPPGYGAPSIAEPMQRHQTADSEHVLKRQRHLGISEEGNNIPVSILPVGNPGQSHAQNLYTSNDLPKIVVANLNQGSTVKSLDFHPSKLTLLLVGTNMGAVSIWEVGGRERLVIRNFNVWNLGACSEALQASLANEYTASVNRVVWSPDGILLGVAYSKHIVHIYSYQGGNELRDHLEIDAHIGNVNDLAFARPDRDLVIVTCGEDKTIKVWNALNGDRLFFFEGHEEPVYSVCPHFREKHQFIFSIGIDGKIKCWFYDNTGSIVDFDAPGQSCTKMAYSADGLRLFSCGTSKDGESHLVEWTESKGTLKRAYNGLEKRSADIVQFDTTKNRFLAAGDEYSIKFWDMDNINLMMVIEADGGLPASPCIRFNKEGILLAVSTSENGVKILANAQGVCLVRAIENRATENRVIENPITENSVIENRGIENLCNENRGIENCTIENPVIENPVSENRAIGNRVIENRFVENRRVDASKLKIWKLKEITKPPQLRSLKLPDSTLSAKIIRLRYTHSGGAILALGYNAVHKLWKWQKNERNRKGKATTSVPPVLWKPASGTVMKNDMRETNLENAVPCFAISKNESYIMSASGGTIGLFNLMTFKLMTTFKPPPPAATFLAFHPGDNNVIAIGMDDSSIQIYNVRLDETQRKLTGHKKKVTGLAFSTALKILVSTGVDAQICVWDSETWEKQNSKYLKFPSGRELFPLAHTKVQFHQDQKQLLVVHEAQIAIYEAPKLERIKQWVPSEGNASITDATYSCDSQSIFASLEDGSVCILTSPALGIRCRISPSAYLPSNLSSSVHPLAITAHPSQQNQLAMGLTDGSLIILEPLEAEKNWGTEPPQENGVGPSSSRVAASSEKRSRK